jgi:hypothetical protein
VTVQTDDKDTQVPARPVSVVWCCHRATCGFTGGVALHNKLVPGASQQQQQPEGPWQRMQHQQQQQLQAQPGQQLQQQQQQPVSTGLAPRPWSGQPSQLAQTQVNTH